MRLQGLRNADLLLARMRKLMNLNATARQQLDVRWPNGIWRSVRCRKRRPKSRFMAPSAFAACMKGNTSTPPTRWRTVPIRCVQFLAGRTMRLALGRGPPVQVGACAFPAAITAIDPMIGKSAPCRCRRR